VVRSRIYGILLVLGLLGSALVAGCGGGRTADGRRGETERNQEAVKKRAGRQGHPAVPPAQRRIDCARVRCVALTFDDGPGEHTRVLLDGLRRSGARVTFFVLGQKVGRHSDLVRRMVYEGHEVGNHTWSHPPMPTLSTSEMRSQVERTQEAVKSASGMRPRVFRPPYGATDKKVARVVNMPQIAWNIDCLDWHPKDSRKGIEAGMKQAGPGGIMLLHDVYPSTVTTVPRIVSGLRQRGFTLVTVSELFQYSRLQTEALYRNLRR
jgi:peptidoglycan/xylan/chitin deacetylase (PgdA/CDA1 family)